MTSGLVPGISMNVTELYKMNLSLFGFKPFSSIHESEELQLKRHVDVACLGGGGDTN